MAVSIAKLAIHLTTDTSGMQRGFAQADRSLNRLKQHVALAAIGRTIFDQLSTPALAAMSAGLLRVSSVASGLLRESLGIAEAWERLDASFKVMLGNADAARGLRMALSDIDKGILADADLQKAARSMVAMGHSAEIVADRIKRFADISIASGEPVEALADSWLRFQADGKVSASDLTRLMQAGVPVLQDLEEHFGMSRRKILEMADAGRISFNDIEDSLKRLTNEGGRFNGAMEEASKTMSGQLRGAWDDLQERMATGLPMLADEIARALTGKDATKIIQKFRNDVLGIGTLENLTAKEQRTGMAEINLQLQNQIQENDKILSEMDKVQKELMALEADVAKAEQDAANRIRSIRLPGAGSNPGVDFNTAAGARSVAEAKAQMNQMIQEQKTTNSELRGIRSAIGGVVNF